MAAEHVHDNFNFGQPGFSKICLLLRLFIIPKWNSREKMNSEYIHDSFNFGQPGSSEYVHFCGAYQNSLTEKLGEGDFGMRSHLWFY